MAVSQNWGTPWDTSIPSFGVIFSYIFRGKGSTEGPVCWTILPIDADSMLMLQTLNSKYVKKGEVSTRCRFYSLNASIQKSFIHPSWCLIAAIRWPLSWQSVLSDDQHVESLVGEEASNHCKSLMIPRTPVDLALAFILAGCERGKTWPLWNAPVSTTILVVKPIKTKVDLTTKNTTNFAVR